MTSRRNSCSTEPMKYTVQIALMMLLCAFSPARAEMTDWVEVQGGAVRLISAGPLQDGHYMAGLEFLLEPGWHTYWRYAGEAGIPPQISVTASDNIENLEILYPVPERYDDGFSESIVYHDGIVLPFRITPAVKDQDAKLEVGVFFGICKDICVPGDAVLTLDFNPSGNNDALSKRLIERDLTAVPRQETNNGLEINSVTHDGKGFLLVEATVGDDGEADLFAAGPEGSFIGLPKPLGRNGDKAIWRLSTKGLATTASDRQLRLVLSSNGTGVERLEPISADWID